MYSQPKAPSSFVQGLIVAALTALAMLVCSQFVLVETGCNSCAACHCKCSNGVEKCVAACDPNFGECFDNSCISSCANAGPGCTTE